MSNPTGDALVAIGIKDTQKLSDRVIRRSLSDTRSRNWSDIYQIGLGVAVGVFVVSFLVI